MSNGVLTPTQRTLRARLAALTLHSQRDPVETTAAAREAFNRRFVDQVDPDRVLSESERGRRAESARRAYFTKLAFDREKTRSAKKKRNAEPENSAPPHDTAEDEVDAPDQPAAT